LSRVFVGAFLSARNCRRAFVLHAFVGVAFWRGNACLLMAATMAIFQLPAPHMQFDPAEIYHHTKI